MPSARFLLQEEPSTFSELVKASALPSFTSDVAMKRGHREANRVFIPILDEEAHVTYYCLCKMDKKKTLEKFFINLTQNKKDYSE